MKNAEVDEDFRAEAEEEVEAEHGEGDEHEDAFAAVAPADLADGDEGIEDEGYPAEDKEGSGDGVGEEVGFAIDDFKYSDSECADVGQALPEADMVVAQVGVEEKVEEAECAVEQCLGDAGEITLHGDGVIGDVECPLKDLLEGKHGNPEVVALRGLGAVQVEG